MAIDRWARRAIGRCRRKLGHRVSLLLLVKVRKSELIDSHSHGAELALFIAAQKGLLAELKELLKQGVAPNAVAPGRAPSCYIASQGGHADVVAALLEARADPDVPEPHAGASPEENSLPKRR